MAFNIAIYCIAWLTKEIFLLIDIAVTKSPVCTDESSVVHTWRAMVQYFKQPCDFKTLAKKKKIINRLPYLPVCVRSRLRWHVIYMSCSLYDLICHLLYCSDPTETQWHVSALFCLPLESSETFLLRPMHKDKQNCLLLMSL